MRAPLFALAVGAFGIGVTEFVIMGLLPNVAADLHVSIPAAGALISGYALGVVIGAPVLSILVRNWPQKQVLLGLMILFTLGNAACAIAPSYVLLMAARVLTAFAHGTFFGVGSVVAASLVVKERRASAIAYMFTGLTVANIAGVPFGTWLGQAYGWRATFWAVTGIGVLAVAVLGALLPHRAAPDDSNWRADLKALRRAPVLLGVATTALGFAGVFTVFTYIAPLLTQVAKIPERYVSPVLLVFGAGLIVGNLAGGRLADRWLRTSLLASLAVLAIVLLAMGFMIRAPATAVMAVALLGVAGFATVPPLQMWVLEKAAGAGQALASSMNIAAFNLGNAVGAAAGGLALARGLGLRELPFIAAVFPLLALGAAWLSMTVAQSARAFPEAIPS